MWNVKFLVQIFMPLLVYGCSTTIEKDTIICDDGNEIWTVGYGERYLQANIFHQDCNIALQEGFIFCQGYPACNKLNVLVGTNNSSWDFINNTYWKAKIKFSDAVKAGSNSYHAIRNVSVLQPDAPHRWNISLEYCSVEVVDGLKVTTSNALNTYGIEGNFTCTEGFVLVNAANKTIVPNVSRGTKCGTCAKWEHMESMMCWKFPKVTLKSNIERFVDGNHLTTEICNVTHYGKPNGSVFLFHKGEKLLSSLTLEPYHHKSEIFCTVENKLTELSDKPPILSEAYVPYVEFGPVEVLNRTTCTATDKELGLFNMILNISFSVNPPFGKAKVLKADNVSITGNNGSVDCCGVPVQRYYILVTNVSSEDKITFLYEHKIRNFTHDFFCVHESDTDNPGDGVVTTFQTDSDNFSTTEAVSVTFAVTTLVIIAVAGGILLIIAITVLCLLIKRRRKLDAAQSESSQPPSPEGQGSEGRLSVLYDTTDLRSSGNVGESVENVLYDSASGTTDVYAAVVKPKNKVGNSGETVENVLYGSATRETDVYAAVVKPKKKSDSKPTDLYAEVVKIKKKKKDSNADDPSVSEATYAAVNKKQKSEKSGKQHKEVDESLQLDQTYAVVDKNRKKK